MFTINIDGSITLLSGDLQDTEKAQVFSELSKLALQRIDQLKPFLNLHKLEEYSQRLRHLHTMNSLELLVEWVSSLGTHLKLILVTKVMAYSESISKLKGESAENMRAESANLHKDAQMMSLEGMVLSLSILQNRFKLLELSSLKTRIEKTYLANCIDPSSQAQQFHESLAALDLAKLTLIKKIIDLIEINNKARNVNGQNSELSEIIVKALTKTVSELEDDLSRYASNASELKSSAVEYDQAMKAQIMEKLRKAHLERTQRLNVLNSDVAALKKELNPDYDSVDDAKEESISIQSLQAELQELKAQKVAKQQREELAASKSRIVKLMDTVKSIEPSYLDDIDLNFHSYDLQTANLVANLVVRKLQYRINFLELRQRGMEAAIQMTPLWKGEINANPTSDFMKFMEAQYSKQGKDSLPAECFDYVLGLEANLQSLLNQQSEIRAVAESRQMYLDKLNQAHIANEAAQALAMNAAQVADESKSEKHDDSTVRPFDRVEEKQKAVMQGFFSRLLSSKSTNKSNPSGDQRNTKGFF
ncbi:MAG: hypothetical protein ABI597_11585 [Gammaproteobacteria bacterium]